MSNNLPEITYQSRLDAPIEDYVRDVKRIWPLNSKRSPLHIWMEVVGRASTVCEGVRKLQWDVVANELAALIMWWFAFIGRVNDLNENSGDFIILRIPNSAGDILWRNYPFMCPVCVSSFIQSNPSSTSENIVSSLSSTCTCIIRKISVERRSEEIKQLASSLTKEISILNISDRPKTLRDFEKMFVSIYQPSTYILSPEEIAFHLLEEVGEVSNALVDAAIHTEFIVRTRCVEADVENFLLEAKEKIEHIEKELADVFSWIISLLEKSKQILSSASRLCIKFNKGIAQKKLLDGLFQALSLPTEKLNIIDIIWKRYEYEDRLGHKTCNSNICECNKEGQLLLEGQHLPDEIAKKLSQLEL